MTETTLRSASDRLSARRVAEWIKDINDREIADQPLGWIAGRYHCAARIAHIWNSEHEGSPVSPQQMATALTEIRDNPDEYDLSVEYREGQDIGRWMVFERTPTSA